MESGVRQTSEEEVLKALRDRSDLARAITDARRGTKGGDAMRIAPLTLWLAIMAAVALLGAIAGGHHSGA